jgi:hypothetical protein
MLNGVHAAPGRQVSTWAHAVKTQESNHVGGSLAIPILRQSLFGLCDRPLQSSRTSEKTTHGKGKPTCVILEPSLSTLANPSSYLNHFWVVASFFPEPH